MSLQTPPPVDDVFALLADPERRAVLAVLREQGAVRERVLARRVAARQHGRTPETVTDEQARTVRLTLWHVHLPRLDETTLVEHDRSAERVEPGPTFESVVPLLGAVAEYDQHRDG